VLKMPKAYLGTLLILTSACYFGPKDDQSGDDLAASEGTTPEEEEGAAVDDDAEEEGVDPEEGDIPEEGGNPEGGDRPDIITGDCNEEEDFFRTFLETNCSGCHANGQAQGSLGNITDIDLLAREQRILAGDFEGSLLYQRISAGDASVMPPPATGVVVDAGSIERVGKYIQECAPVIGFCGDSNEYLDLDDQFALMADDINSIRDEDEELNTRYLTLTHLHNAGYCTEQIQPFRDAMTHAVNSLSTEPRIVNPRVVEGSFDTIYAVDIRDYGWDEQITTIVDSADPVRIGGTRAEALTFVDKWDLMMFDLEKSWAPDPNLFEDAADIQDTTQQGIFFAMADEFAFIGTQAPTYHDVLELPLTIQEIDLKFLGVPRAELIVDEESIRAGLLNSGVSQQNRLVECFDQPTGLYYCVSYDFANDALNEQNLFVSPVGPESVLGDVLVNEDNLFLEAGGEGLFQLPNGLMAAVLYTSADDPANLGIRLSKGPTNIVTDPKTDDGAVLNGTSCYTCHQQGLIAFADELLANVRNNRGLLDGASVDYMEAVYLEEDEFREALQDYSESFLDAKAELDIDLDAVVDQVFANYQFHTFQDMPVELIEAEIGLNSESALFDCVNAFDAWSPLRAGEGAVLARDVHDEFFDDCILELNLGTPANVLAINNGGIIEGL